MNEVTELLNGILLWEEIPHSNHFVLFRQTLNIVDLWSLWETAPARNKAEQSYLKGVEEESRATAWKAVWSFMQGSPMFLSAISGSL